MTALARMSGGQAIGALLVACVVLMLLAAYPIGLLGAGVAIAFAKLGAWPKVPLRAYIQGGRLALPLAAWGAGAAGQFALTEARNGVAIVVAGGVAAALLSIVILIFEGKLMQSIFKLVPADQRSSFDDKLTALDAERAGAVGQAADFSALAPEAVAAAIKQRVVGQDGIVDEVVSVAFRRARLARPNKPVGVFLFVGATGAGKTELAKALAGALFDGRMIRVDCNELSESQNVQRLIGAPPGYIGSDQGGQLCRDLARVGTGVLLLDEIEKAHPATLKVLMNLLDEARLTEQSTGRTYSARGFLIVLTSNAAAAEIAKVAEVETDLVSRGTKTKDALRDAGFLPEVLARIDAVFPFSQLSSRDVALVVERFLLQFARDVGVELVSCDAELLLDLVTRAHKTRDYGIREVVRGVENAVVDGLIAVKDSGHRRAAIRVHGGMVVVEPATV